MTLTCPNCIALHKGKKGVRSTEVWALASVFEKSPTELKQKQKLLKCKSTIQMATFNIRTLNRKCQILELTASATDHNMTPSHGQARVGRPVRTYLQKLSTDTGCSMEHLPGAIENRHEWRERVREIRASSMPWWYLLVLYIYIYRERERVRERKIFI